MLEKVTAFITRPSPSGTELLLFHHPHAGVQIPAGTVEPGEPPSHAALREAAEETGLDDLHIIQYLGSIVESHPEGIWGVLEKTKVFARPDLNSYDWAEFKIGVKARQLRRANGFVQLTFEEWDRYPVPEYLSYQITGWVPESCLCRQSRRHYFHLGAKSGGTSESWLQKDEYHEFELFWAPLHDLPEIVPPQAEWLRQVRDHFHYAWK